MGSKKTSKPFLYGPGSGHEGIVILKQEKAFPTLKVIKQSHPKGQFKSCSESTYFWLFGLRGHVDTTLRLLSFHGFSSPACTSVYNVLYSTKNLLSLQLQLHFLYKTQEGACSPQRWHVVLVLVHFL